MQQLSLFDTSNDYSLSPATAPLADRMRPRSLEDYVGQTHLLGEGKLLRQMLEKDQVCSMIFWGPPGVGKTTLAKIIAGRTKSDFLNFSAVTSGIKEIKEIMKQAEGNRNYGIRTLVFVDEIHRFNKAQQDAFLPYVERGSITLIGATTENPSFEINGAKADALTRLSEPVPLVIRNAPTQLMDELHYGEGYVYAHDTAEKMAHMTCLPEGLKDRRYYLPTEEGNERIFKERLAKSRAFRLGKNDTLQQ